MTERPSEDRAAVWGAAVIVAVIALALRLPWLDRLGLHLDEDISTLAARGVAHTGLPLLPSGHWYLRAPLYHYLLAPFVTTGVDWVPRILSVLLGAITGVLVVWGGSRAFGLMPATVAGLLLALSIIEISFARIIRMYSLYQPLALVALYLLWRFWTTGDRRWGVLSAIAVLVSLGGHELGVSLAFLYLPIAIRHTAPRVRNLCLALVPCFGVVFLLYDRVRKVFFRGTGARVIEPPELSPFAHAFRVKIVEHPLGFGQSTVGTAGLIAVLLTLIALGVAIALRGTRGRPSFLRLAAAVALAGALAASGAYELALAGALFTLIALQREELFPGKAGAQAVALGASLAAVCALVWILAALGAGYSVRDIALGVVRWPGHLAQLLLWPPLMAAFATGALLFIIVRAWRGRAGESERFLALALIWLVAVRGLLDRRVQPRYLADIWPLWELLAGIGIVAVAAWLTRAARPAARGRLTAGVAFAVVLVFALLPGTSVPDSIAFISRPHGATTELWNRVETPVSDLRGACDWLERRLEPGDRIVATDWLTTYCYLGRVDGWVRASAYSWQSSTVGGVTRDCYVNAEVLPDLAALQRFAAKGRVWVVAGAEEMYGADDLVRPDVRDWLLAQPQAFIASDGRTRVIRIDRAH